ncbi:MAG: TonB-dependent receptor [Acidobacteria bacterium]|nr:TonB-dependent receptor [Acidobacteriota bacterium]
MKHRQRPCLLLLAAVASHPAWTQSTASLRIRALDAQGRPRAGVQVELESQDRGERRVLRTGGDGVAAAAGLLPGAWKVQGQWVQLRADERAEVVLRGEALGATVAVEASPLRTESSSVAVQTTLSARDFERLPFGPHRYLEQSYLAPGVTPSGKPEPVVLGSMLDANSYLVDGMPTNLGSTGRFGMNLSTEILESQTLTTGGHKAEIAFTPGGAFSLVTRSGGNEFHGALLASGIWRGFNARPDPGKVNYPEERATHAREWTLSLGGPILQDRLFFFGALSRQLTDQDIENIAPPGAPPHRRTLAEDRSYRFLKFTWLATPDHRVELSAFQDPVIQVHFDDPANASLKDEQLGNRNRGGTSWLFKHAGALSPTVFWENTLGLHGTEFRWYPGHPEAGPSRAQLDAPFKEGFGAYPEERLERIRNLSLRSEVTVFQGEHQVKAGFQGLRARFTTVYRRPSGGLAFTDRAAGGAGPAAGDLAAIRAGLAALNGSDFAYAAGDSLATPSPVNGLLVGGRGSYLFQRTLSSLEDYGSPLAQTLAGLYAQDDWKLSENWILNLGLRVDRARVDAEDGRSIYRQTLLSPRLGFSWDPGGKGRLRLFAYAGRIYSPPAPGALAAAGATTGGPALERQVWIPSLGAWRSYERTGTQGVRNVAIAADLRAARTDLLQAGMERLQALPGLGDWILEAVLTRKWTRDLVDTYNPAWGYLPEFAAAANASAGKRFIGNLPGLERAFTGLDLSAQRRFEGGHRLQLSFSHGDLRGNSEVGNVAGASGKNTGFAAIPSLREDYRGARYGGPLNESVKHAWKAFGSAALPWGVELSGILVLRSGLRYSILTTVSGDNVLAPGTARGERELPRVATLDLSLGRVFLLGGLQVRGSLEALNALNAQPMIWVNNVGPATTPGNHLQPRTLQMVARLSF